MTREVFILSLSLFPSDNHHLVLSTLPCPSLLPLIAFLIWIVSAGKLGFPPPIPLLSSLASTKLPQDYFLNAALIVLLSC